MTNQEPTPTSRRLDDLISTEELDTLTANLDRTIVRIGEIVKEAEDLRIANRTLTYRLSRTEAERDVCGAFKNIYQTRYEKLRDLAAELVRVWGNGNDEEAVIERLRAMLAPPPVTPTAVEGRDA